VGEGESSGKKQLIIRARNPQAMNSVRAHRILAAIWFLAFGFLFLCLFFHAWRLAFRAVFLFIFLPTVAAAAAGCLWGGAILDRGKTSTLGQALTRGVVIAAAAFVIFAALFAVALPVVERGWSWRESGGLFVLTSTLGVFLAGPLVLLGGMVAGGTLYLFGRNSPSRQTDIDPF